MTVSLVVAAAQNNAIGKENRLLWCLPNDMRFFKNITWGMVVIMGRKTFESLGRALKGRKNIVITRQATWKAEGAVTVGNLDEALLVAKGMDAREVFVIGGGEIYRMSLAVAKRVYLTRVQANPDGADAFFPSLDEKEWKLISHKDYPPDEKHQYGYSFQLWERP